MTTSRRRCCCGRCRARGRFRYPWSGARRTGAVVSFGDSQLAQRAGDGVDADAGGFYGEPSDARLTEILVALNEEPNVLVVFNHPMWDLYLVGAEKHQFLVNEFLQKNGNYLHAMELNGLRHWDENRATRRLRRSGTCCSSPAATVTAWNRTRTSI